MPSNIFSSSTLHIIILTWIIARCTLAQYVQGPRVIPLIEGVQSRSGGSTYIASVTLILDGPSSIVVDTPSGPNEGGRDKMLAGLINDGKLLPDQVEMLVITHGHPDHFGHDMLFTSARHIFFAFEQHSDAQFAPLNYHDGSAMLSTNVELRQTPGHTPQDTSVIVKNVPNQGTIAVTGDLIYDANDALNSSSSQAGFAWNAEALLENRNKILCEADFVIPGHGPMFQVTDQMRQLARCEEMAPTNQIAIDEQMVPTYEVPIAEQVVPTYEVAIDQNVVPIYEVPTDQQVASSNQVPVAQEVAPTNHIPIAQPAGPTNQVPVVQEVAPTNQIPIVQQVVPTTQRPIIQQVVPTNQVPIAQQVAPNSQTVTGHQGSIHTVVPKNHINLSPLLIKPSFFQRLEQLNNGK